MNLFKSLNEDTKNRLKAQLPIALDSLSLELGVQNFCSVGAGIEKVLEYHQNTFTEWRYSYEKESGISCYVSELNNVLAAIIKTYVEIELQNKQYSKND